MFRRRGERSSLALVVALVMGSCLPSTRGLVVGEVDAGGPREEDASPPEDPAETDAGSIDGAIGDSASIDAASPDAGAGQTTLDVECSLDWIALDQAEDPSCLGRQVVVVSEPVVTRALALSREPNGRLVIAYNTLNGADSGAIEIVELMERNLALDAPVDEPVGEPIAIIAPDAAIGDVAGVSIAVASEPPETTHLAYWYRSDFGNEVRYRTLVGNVLTPVETLATAVGRSGVVDVTVDTRANAAVVYHDDTAGLIRAVRQVEDAFGAPVTLRSEGLPEAPGAGAVAIKPGFDGTVHAVYQWAVTLAATAPSYSLGTDEGWSTARTLDNRIVSDRLSGVGIDLAIVGDERIAAYFDWQAGVGEVRLAMFSATAEDPVVTHFRSEVVLEDPPGHFPLDLEVDAEGLLHLVTAEAGSEVTFLEYHRQSLASGEPRWLTDRIETLAEPPSEVLVDMVIGPDRRPHIVYWVPSTGVVHYATARPLPLTR